MTPFFIFSTPRDCGSVLVRILDATPGVRCAGEAHNLIGRAYKLYDWRSVIQRDHPLDFLPSAERPGHHPRYLQHSTADSWGAGFEGLFRGWVNPEPTDTHFGFRDIFTLRDGDWATCLNLWSWIQISMPGAKIIFTTRDDEDQQVSVALTEGWIPNYGSCNGNLLNRIRAMRVCMTRYHALNPSTTMLIDAADLADFETLHAKLSVIGITLDQDSWASEKAIVLGTPRQLRPLPAGALPVVVEEPPPLRLPIPVQPATMPKTAVYTLRYGTVDWIEACAPTLDDWCFRHGYELKVWSEGNPDYPDEKYTTLDMMRDFLASDAERMVFVDADVCIHPAAPSFPFEPGFHAAVDPMINMRHWQRWLDANQPGFDITGWGYRNSGVWSCDRESAVLFLRATVGDTLAAGTREQHQFNVWWLKAVAAGMTMHLLAMEWNSLSKFQLAPAWFFHLAGKNKMKHLGRARTAHFLPAEPQAITILPKIDLPLAIVYPWLSKGTDWQELLFSLRSVLENFQDKTCPIFILGDQRPEWLNDHPRVKFLECPAYEDALQAGVQLAERIVWMNDDIYLLKPVAVEDLHVALSMGDDILPNAQAKLTDPNPYVRGKARVTLDLHHHGFSQVRDFSSHTPYFYERDKALHTLGTFGVFWKTPFETAYHNQHGTPFRPIAHLRSKTLPAPHAVYLNHESNRLTDDLKVSIAERFPHPAPWEAAAVPVVVFLALHGKAPHVEEFQRVNPSIPVHVDHSLPGDTKLEGWRNADRRLMNWWELNRHTAAGTHFIFCEWDVRFSTTVAAAFPYLSDFAVPEVKNLANDPHWSWWAEGDRLPEGMTLMGIAPLAVLQFSRRALDAMLELPVRAELMAADVFCEIRLPSIATAAGYPPERIATLSNVRYPSCINLPAGISHPVKVEMPGTDPLSGLQPFNDDGHLRTAVGNLISKWGIEVTFETGTFEGHTTAFLASVCPSVITCDIDPQRAASAGGKGFQNIEALPVSSPDAIASKASDLVGKRVLYYLDAHWGDYWPLLDELKAIAAVDAPPPVIVIHDFHVPGRPQFGFDTWNGQRLDLDYVRPGLDAIYGNGGYATSYNRQATGARRGVLFVEPVDVPVVV